jgi:hypothetical protein
MPMPPKLFPDDIINHYNLQEKALNVAKYTWRFNAAGTVYHMLASWQTSSFDNTWVGMATSKYITHPGCWKHVSCPIWFNLCVNNFGVR